LGFTVFINTSLVNYSLIPGFLNKRVTRYITNLRAKITLLGRAIKG